MGIQLKREVLAEFVLSISQLIFANTICITYRNAQVLQGQNRVHYHYEFFTQTQGKHTSFASVTGHFFL